MLKSSSHYPNYKTAGQEAKTARLKKTKPSVKRKKPKKNNKQCIAGHLYRIFSWYVLKGLEMCSPRLFVGNSRNVIQADFSARWFHWDFQQKVCLLHSTIPCVSVWMKSYSYPNKQLLLWQRIGIVEGRNTVQSSVILAALMRWAL